MLRFIDGFDHYATADIGTKWTNVHPSTTVVAAIGRNSTAGFRFGGQNQHLGKVFDNQATWIVGFAYKPSTEFGNPLVFLMDNGSLQCELKVNSSGKLYIARNGTQVGSLSTYTLPLNTWTYLEFKATIADSIGADTCVVRADGVIVLTLAAASDIKNTANAYANEVRLNCCSISNGVICELDDVYICDGTGSVNNNFLGDMRVVTLWPSDAGTTTDFTPSAGSNFQCVDDVAASDGDSTYVSSSTVNHKDTYAFGDLATTPVSIAGIQTVIAARKDDAGARSITPVVRSGGTDYDGTTVSLSDSYVRKLEIRELNPNGSVAWTGATVNAIEAGAKLIA